LALGKVMDGALNAASAIPRFIVGFLGAMLFFVGLIIFPSAKQNQVTQELT
jgi:ABC-type dipeptide/oligopeptide/nickel transport system permease component